MNIAEEFHAIIMEFSILAASITCIATDNAANIKLAVSEAGWEQCSCLSHNLQLYVEDGLKLDHISHKLGCGKASHGTLQPLCPGL